MNPINIDKAIELFKKYCEGKNGFDELDFKQWLIEQWKQPEITYTESEFIVEMEQQAHSFIELNPNPLNDYSVQDYIKHLSESYV